MQVSGMPELQAFRRHLSDYKISVFSDRVGKDLMFEGDVNTGRNIDLIYEPDGHHFNVITNLAAAFTVDEYCRRCNIEKNKEYYIFT
jgi:hypothetical protein